MRLNPSTTGLWAWTGTAVAVGASISIWYLRREGNTPKSDETAQEDTLTEEPSTAPLSEIQCDSNNNGATDSLKKRILAPSRITIAHGSVTGTCRTMAHQLYEQLQEHADVQMGTTEEFDWWDELLNAEENNQKGETPLLIILLPTYTDGTWPPVALPLQNALQDLQHDWRVAKNPLKGQLQVAVFGMGSSAYAEIDGGTNMGRPAKEAVRSLTKLGAKCVVRVAVGDNAVGTHAHTTFDAWRQKVVAQCQKNSSSSSSCGCGNESKNDGGCCQVEEEKETAIDYDEYSDEEDGDQVEPEVMDLEDMGDSMMASGDSATENAAPQEMVTPSQAAALKKEGYKLIGTHSAVKLCRWTKHQLRGRGGCYKHTFYGITSYQCMEATPSLACANKCVFCWRHHKNPVGKEWRWKTDDPQFIVQQAVETHVRMIKEARGIPGVRMDRWKEAHTVRHCALSLVGEPIMYPRIDELLGELHHRNISTFLVTNGQHPQAIEKIRPITQLYVSVDAPTKESLIAIDRPLFNDAWDRLRKSLSSLKTKGQRTVARLTVVKGWNSEEVEDYAKLIALGQVSLVEVKGVTFCGKSDASNLNMSNTPWHHEVVALTRKLKDEINKLRNQGGPNMPPEYDLACEHKHSCSVLLARVDQFAIDDTATGKRRWRTWIDYDKFQELAARNAKDPSFVFSVQDYTAETPAWALFGAEEEGFDPTDTRHRKKQKYPKYTQFDERGIPTHDHNEQVIGIDERVRLAKLMDEKMNALGSDTVITELKDGGKEIADPSLMFRGMVIAK